VVGGNNNSVDRIIRLGTAHFCQRITAGRGAHLSQPVGLEILYTELFGTTTELFGEQPNYYYEVIITGFS
jgi:hypothetical protein